MSGAGAYLSEAEVSARLQALEIGGNLLRHEWDGWCVWPLFRFSVSRKIQHLPLDASGAGFSRREYAGMALRDLFRLWRVRRAEILVKTYSSAHMELEGGRRKDVFFDDLLGASAGHFKIEFPNSRRFHVQTAPHVFPPDLSTVAIDGLAIQLARRFPPAGVEAVAAALSAALTTEPELAAYTPHFVARLIAEFHWAKRLYRALLRRVRPSVLLLADAGDYAVTAAARELGVHVIEFQHGFTHRHFPGNSWPRAALAYKSKMPLPHRMFLYGPHWQREVAANGFWSEELRAVGSMRIDRHRTGPVARDPAVCSIVVTTQGTDTERLVQFLAQSLPPLEGQMEYCVTIKTHPTYHGGDRFFTEAFGGNRRVTLVAGSESPSTFELLRAAHLHVSIYSTCHYEALALGVPTVILPLTGSENVIHLHHAGHAFCPSTPAELAGIVLRWREYRVPAQVGDEYFTPGALENIQRELAALPPRAA
jgi:hypothetical protein